MNSLTIRAIMVAILAQFLPVEELNQFIDAGVTIAALLTAWYGRYRVGDITWWGGRK